MERPRVFTIPPGCPFLPTLVDSLLSGRVLDGFPADPAALADLTIYLPTQRAARALGALLADRGGARAQLLPRIVPLGEADEAEFVLTAEQPSAAGDVLAPPIAPLERRLILTRLVQAWSATIDRARLKLSPDVPFLVPSSPADAVSLAGDLEALMDSFTTEGVDWSKLETAVDSDFSEYFKVTTAFVRIAAESWPAIVAGRQASDPIRRRTSLIEAEAKRLLRDRPPAPVIAAGSTGSVPATARLLAAIARLPHGAVVLPGLDTDLDEPSWQAIGGHAGGSDDPVHGHPQAILRRLLDAHLRIGRSEVGVLGTPPARAAARQRLLCEALRPADSTHLWSAMPPQERSDLAREGAEGLALVEAADEREEALAIAVALRESLEDPDRTAAFVTPDRALAGRVAAELARWGLAVEDSAGVSLAETPCGRLARLAADAAALDFAAARVLALLAHPLATLGWPRAQVERAASVLEIGVLRGPAPAQGLTGLREALAARRADAVRRKPRPERRLSEADWDLAGALLDRLEVAFRGFTADDVDEDALDLSQTAALHRQAVEALLAPAEEAEARAGDDDGSAETLAALFDELALSDIGGIAGRFSDYPAFFTALAKQRTLDRTPRAGHRRVKILGLLEARLLGADRVVLGGLDEGVWPPRAETDAFLNRPMRAAVGLSPPERRIGQTAHDFVQALGCPDVIVTRAQKRNSSPMVPSRLLQRLAAFVGKPAWEDLVARGDRYRALAHRLDEPAQEPLPLVRPAPKPDPALIPRALSVTEIETLVRDPYAIFARHILKLDPLDSLALVPGAADRGTIVHEVLGRFAKAAPETLPAAALELLLQIGQDEFAPIAKAYPELYAEWWPRFERIAAKVLDWEEGRRGAIRRVHSEIAGLWTFTLPDGSAFALRARADRIEENRDGSFAIVDFKTGAVPSAREVFAGFSPQLTLEAAMLMQGAFRDVPRATRVPGLAYVHVSGGRKALDERAIEPGRDESRSVAELVADHRVKLEALLARYVAGEAGFVSRPYPKYAKRYGAYDHLARVKEWSLASSDGEAP